MDGWIALNLLLASLAAGTGNVTHTLATANSVVEFTVGEHGAFISRWDFKTDAGMKRLVAAKPRVPFWTVVLQRTTGDRAVVTALSGPAVVRDETRTRLKLEWTGLQPGDVDVTVTISVRGADLVWGLAAAVNAPKYALWNIGFPAVGPVARVNTMHSITTQGWGVLHDNLKRGPLYEGLYPSAQCGMPFVAVSDGTAGLYLGAEDPQGYPLRLFVGRGKERSAVTLGIQQDIPDMGTVRKYTIPYALVTTAYAGDWYEAAQLYRVAAAKTPWGGVPPLSQRKDIPKWLLDTDLWYIGPCDDEKTAEGVLDFAKYFKVPVSAHVYNWHQIPFDTRYPEYFPAKPGFSDAVKKVQQAGVAVMPYINGRLWDAATASWKEKNARQAAALNEDGKPYREVYGSKVPLTPMCPSTRLWQDTITRLVDRLVNQVGVRGVYIDQIAAASPKLCFATNHGHPRGGGTYWIQGYRELLRRCRAVLPVGTGLTTEENADPWNDLLQGFLMVNTRPHGGKIVPLYPAVYAGRVVYFGFQYFSAADYSARYPLRIKLAQELTFGSQLGWVGPAILEKQNATEAAFLKGLCQVRHGARDALQYGQLLPPVAIECNRTVSWTEKTGDKSQKKTAPAVYVNAWRTPKGKRVLAAVNIADESETVALTLDSRQTGDINADHLALRPRSGPPAATLQRDKKSQYHGTVTIPARTAVVLEIAPDTGAP